MKEITAWIKECLERCEKATPGPWEWKVQDLSMVTLEGPKGEEDAVMAADRCKSCQEMVQKGDSWETFLCSMPGKHDSDVIAKSRTEWPKALKMLAVAVGALKAVQACSLSQSYVIAENAEKEIQSILNSDGKGEITSDKNSGD